MEPIRIDELAAAVGGVLPTPADGGVVFERVAIDPHHVVPGTLFWAIEADNSRIPTQVALAEARGAAGVVVSSGIAVSHSKRILVPDSREALRRFAGWYRRLLDSVVVVIAGDDSAINASNLIRAALGLPLETVAGEAPDGSDEKTRLALDLLELNAADPFAVVRSDSPDAVSMLRPEVAILTGMAGTPTRIANRLWESLPRGGFAILPGDAPEFPGPIPRTRATTSRIGFGRDNTHHLSADIVSPGRIRFRLGRSHFEIAAASRRVSLWAGVAVVAARCLGRRDLEIAKDLEAFRPIFGHGDVAISHPWAMINETAFGHPASVAAAMDGLAQWPATGRRFFVCGDLDEDWVGRGERAFSDIDGLMTIGHSAGQMAHEARNAGMDAHCLAECNFWKEAFDRLTSILRRGDVVWIKSSRSAGLDRLVTALADHAESERGIPLAA